MTRIRLGIDARPLSWPEARGVQRVARNLLREISDTYADEIEMVLYSNRPLIETPPNSSIRILTGNQWLYNIIKLPKAAKADKCDVFLGMGSAILLRSCPSIFIVYDAYPNYSGQWHPSDMPLRIRMSHRYLASWLAVRAKVVAMWSANALICNSESVLIPRRMTTGHAHSVARNLLPPTRETDSGTAF